MAFLRDELHLVANRIERIRAVPGTAIVAALPSVMPTARHRIASGPHLLTLLQLAVDRLTEITSDLEPSEWLARGQLGSLEVSIEQLAVLPLHRSYARLTQQRLCA